MEEKAEGAKVKFTEQDLKDAFSRNRSLAERNIALACSAPSAKSEPPICHEPLAEAPRTDGHSPRYAVRIICHRSRLIDPDNACGKAFVDCLRHAGIIPDDTAAIMDYSISQQKAKSKKEQFTEIVIERLT